MGLFGGGSRSSSTTHNQTDNTSTNVATGDGDGALILTGDGITVDKTDDNLVNHAFTAVTKMLSQVKDSNDSVLSMSKEIASSGLSLAERSKTNEQLNWLSDMAKLIVPATAISLVAYFFFKYKK
jgi:hypothetical protein